MKNFVWSSLPKLCSNTVPPETVQHRYKQGDQVVEGKHLSMNLQLAIGPTWLHLQKLVSLRLKPQRPLKLCMYEAPDVL